MFADLPENYVHKPAFQFLLDVPVNWEDTKVLNGEIGKYITTVRKDIDSDDWYLGSITNEESRELNIDLLIFLIKQQLMKHKSMQMPREPDIRIIRLRCRSAKKK